MSNCPLTGKLCSNIRNVKIIETIEGKKNQFNLCQKCAESFLTTEKTSVEIMNENISEPKDNKKTTSKILSNILNLFNNKNKTKNEKTKNEDFCPHCKMTISEIVKLKRLGCMKCYEHFGDKILPLINNIQGATKHVGKVPKNFKKEQPKSIEQYIVNLKKLMDEAIKEENYEAAALHRDSLKIANTIANECLELEKELKKHIEENNKPKEEEIKNKIKSIIMKCLNSLP